MTKQINYGTHETIKDSHRTLSDAVTMYAIYYSDYGDVLEEVSQYYASDEWQNAGFGQDLPRHIELMKKRNAIVREMKSIGEELRSVGLDIDLCVHARVDDYFDEVA